MVFILLGLHCFLALLCCGHLFLQAKRPTIQSAWIFAIFIMPILGVLAYLVLGTDRLRLRRERRRSQYRPRDDPRYAVDATIDSVTFASGDVDAAGWLRALDTINDFQPTTGNQLQPLLDASSFYEALRHDIAQARKQICLCFYVWRDDRIGREFLQLLTAAVERGVDVRLLVDELGSGHTPDGIFSDFRQAGGHYSWSTTINPRRNRWLISLRNHRKICVIDGHTGYVGGMNIGAEYLDGHEGMQWNDAQVRTRGPIVRQLLCIYADDWHFATAEVMDPLIADDAEDEAPADDRLQDLSMQMIAGGPDHEPSRTAQSIAAIVGMARQRIVLTTPYFVPDEGLLASLEIAISRGVSIDLMVSAESDMGALLSISRSYYRRLLEAGVHITEYPKDIHHAKCILVDDCWVMIGSVNLDVRSFHLNYENALLIRSEALHRTMENYLKSNLQGASAIQIADLDDRPIRVRLREGCYRLLAPML